MGFKLMFGEALQQYSKNFSTVLGFGLLLVFVFLFARLSGVFISSGSVFVFFEQSNSGLFSLGALFLLGAVFMFFYSVFVCLMVFAVRNYLNRVKLNYYLTQKIRKFALKYFVFSFVLSLIAYLFVLFANFLQLPLSAVFLALFLVFSLFLFVPQAIVVDEAGLVSSVSGNFEFILKNFGAFMSVVVTGIALLFLVILIEFVFDSFLFVGNIFSLLLVFFFIIPFLEIIKTDLYMKKFTLLV